jgi:exosortase
MPVLKELLGEAANGKMDMRRNLLFVALVAVAVLMFYGPFKDLMRTTLHSEYYSHIALIPFVSAYLLFIRRREIFSNIEYAFFPGAGVCAVGVLIYGAARILDLEISPNDRSSLIALSVVLFAIGAFILLYGFHAFKAARFALLFLIFIIPVPTALMDALSRALQLGSAEFVDFLFSITGVPVLRDGVVFNLPGLSIEVAPQCSGIRSSLALVITAVLAGHMFLKSTWKKVVLVLAVIPVTMFKNGIRIVTLSLLGVYVDRGFLESSLHRDGGIVFFVLALLLMAPVLFLLRRMERGG